VGRRDSEGEDWPSALSYAEAYQITNTSYPWLP